VSCELAPQPLAFFAQWAVSPFVRSIFLNHLSKDLDLLTRRDSSSFTSPSSERRPAVAYWR